MSTFARSAVTSSQSARNAVLPYPTPLPPGTRVQRRPGEQLGVVGDYDVRTTGWFPVDWADIGFGAISELCGPDDVIILSV